MYKISSCDNCRCYRHSLAVVVSIQLYMYDKVCVRGGANCAVRNPSVRINSQSRKDTAFF